MLKTLMNQNQNVSLRTLAAACGVNYNYLLKLSHKPIKGEVYDPDAVNYAEVQNMLQRRGVNIETLDWDGMNQKGASSRVSIVTKDTEAFQVGVDVYLRKDKTVPYTIVYRTATHVVILNADSTKPSVMNWDTFIQQGPSLTPRTAVEETVAPEELKPKKGGRRIKKEEEVEA